MYNIYTNSKHSEAKILIWYTFSVEPNLTVNARLVEESIIIYTKDFLQLVLFLYYIPNDVMISHISSG